MKKLLIAIIIIALVVLVGVSYIQTKFGVDITDQDLPQAVYAEEGSLLLTAQAKLAAIINPLSTEDDYELTEEFLNYMLLYSIRNNVNEEYNPLDAECEEPACDFIVETQYVDIEYAYVRLTDDNQILLTVSFNRSSYPNLETAIYATFDIDISLINMEMVLTLDTVYLADTEITRDQLDSIVSFFDKDSIEESIAMGTLDLDDYTYTISLLPN